MKDLNIFILIGWFFLSIIKSWLPMTFGVILCSCLVGPASRAPGILGKILPIVLLLLAWAIIVRCIVKNFQKIKAKHSSKR